MWGRINDSLGRGLTVLALRQRLLAHNIANAETPGYKRYDVRFDALLDERLRATPLSMIRTHLRHMVPASTPSTGEGVPPGAIYRETATTMRNDGNNVDMDAEMARLAETALHYQALVRQLSDRIALLRTAIHEGRR